MNKYKLHNYVLDADVWAVALAEV